MSPSTGNARSARFFNYPQCRATEHVYQGPPPPSNPVIKGAALHYLSNIVAAVPWVPYLLWKNAGFGSLRSCKEIANAEPRLDPTVIALAQPGEETADRYARATGLWRAPPDHGRPRFYTVADIHHAYKSGACTPMAVVEALLPMIRRDVAQRGPHSTAFTESNIELVRQAAQASTRRWEAGRPLGMLDGVPFAVKDDLDVAGYKRHMGTRHDYTNGSAVETSWCVAVFEREGAVLLGKLNMHELGSDTTNNNPIWGTPLNPYNNSYYPGGSSGGVASVVGHGIVPFGIGSDGGGSVRIPSNYCGLFGLKTSHGRVSVAPMPGGMKSVVVRGPLATSMADLELAYQVLAQPNPSHFPSSHFSPPKAQRGPRNKVIGICKPWFDRADPPVQEACQCALRYLQAELGYTMIEISIPLLQQGQLAHAMTILAEGVDLSRPIWELTPANRILMKVARQTPATDFLLAQRLRNVIMEHLADLFVNHPGLIIATPTTPNAGWPIEDADVVCGMSNANMTLRNMEYVWLANFTGIPCLQVPVGYMEGLKGQGKVPVGLSGHGDWGSENALIEFGYDCEKWLHEGLAGGKPRPSGWIDILNLDRK
ncbi:hypothetical protein ACEQ8H_002303 [Pleosporales sp. CAS-2024a]